LADASPVAVVGGVPSGLFLHGPGEECDGSEPGAGGDFVEFGVGAFEEAEGEAELVSGGDVGWGVVEVAEEFGVECASWDEGVCADFVDRGAVSGEELSFDEEYGGGDVGVFAGHELRASAFDDAERGDEDGGVRWWFSGEDVVQELGGVVSHTEGVEVDAGEGGSDGVALELVVADSDDGDVGGDREACAAERDHRWGRQPVGEAEQAGVGAEQVLKDACLVADIVKPLTLADGIGKDGGAGEQAVVVSCGEETGLSEVVICAGGPGEVREVSEPAFTKMLEGESAGGVVVRGDGGNAGDERRVDDVDHRLVGLSHRLGG